MTFLLRKFLLFVAIVLLTKNSFGQKTIPTADEFFKGIYKNEISTRSISKKGIAHKFHSVTVIDNRPDTVRVSFFLNNFNRHNEVVVKGSLAEIFSLYLTDATQKEDILLSIEDLWISNRGSETGATLIFRIKSYTQKNGAYTPLTIIEDSISIKKKIVNCAGSLISDAIEITANKIYEKLSVQKLLNTKTFTLLQIDSIRNRRYQFPIHSATNLTKGVYYTIEQLQNNTPVNVPFTLQKVQHIMPYVYLKDKDSSEFIAQKIVGVCDGNQIFLVYAGQAFPLYKSGRAFYTLSLERFRSKVIPLRLALGVAAFAIYSGGIHAGTEEVLSPYLVNMEEGGLYQ